MEELLTLRSFVHAVSGAAGGISAISVFYPLNALRTRLQVSDAKHARSTAAVLAEIARQEGVASLYQGWWSTVVSLGASNFVYFYAYNALKAMFRRLLIRQGQKGDIGPILNLLIASIAGAVNVLLTTPLWVVGTRLTVQEKDKEKREKSRPYRGVWDALVRIADEEGPKALWNGLVPSLILVSNPSIQFVAYERLKGAMSRLGVRRGYGITPLEFFVMGAVAKAIATVATYPLQVAQARLRTTRKAKGPSATTTQAESERPLTVPRYSGTVDCLMKVYQSDGFLGWFRGMEAKLWQTVLTAAFQFLTYEQISRFIFRAFMGDAAKGTGTASVSAGGG